MSKRGRPAKAKVAAMEVVERESSPSISPQKVVTRKRRNTVESINSEELLELEFPKKRKTTKKSTKPTEPLQDVYISNNSVEPPSQPLKKKEIKDKNTENKPLETKLSKKDNKENEIVVNKAQTTDKQKATIEETVTKEMYDKLKEKYDTLRTLRTTEVEQLYQDFQKNVAAREQVTKELIEGLKSDNDLLQLELAKTKKQTVELRHNNLQHEDLISIINFYQKLTSIHVDELENGFACSMNVRGRDVAFDLVFNRNTEGEVEYIPEGIAELITDFKITVPNHYPPFGEALDFRISQLPNFLYKLLASLLPK